MVPVGPFLQSRPIVILSIQRFKVKQIDAALQNCVINLVKLFSLLHRIQMFALYLANPEMGVLYNMRHRAGESIFCAGVRMASIHIVKASFFLKHEPFLVNSHVPCNTIVGRRPSLKTFGGNVAGHILDLFQAYVSSGGGCAEGLLDAVMPAFQGKG